MYPGKDADKGSQEFTYSFFVHGSDYVNQINAQGYALNDPPKAFNGKAPEAFIDSPVALCDTSGIAIDWVKLAEDGSGVIVRAYEFAGKNANVNISLNEMFGDKKAYICDLMENELCEVEGKTEFKPYEIHTFKFV